MYQENSGRYDAQDWLVVGTAPQLPRLASSYPTFRLLTCLRPINASAFPTSQLVVSPRPQIQLVSLLISRSNFWSYVAQMSDL
jgi:hypothetical protein